MNKKRTSTLIVIIVILIFGVLSYLNHTKGLFKTNKQKFFKYIEKNNELINIFDCAQIQSIRSKKNQKNYKTDSNMIINMGDDSYTITANTLAQSSNDVLTTINVQFNNENITNFNVVKKSNLVGIKMNELANGYICIKNNNILDLAKRAEMENINKLPDNINWISSTDLLYISQGDMNYLHSRLADAISKNITESNFSNEESSIKVNDDIHTVKGYKVSLTENEMKRILRELYSGMSEDSRALNIISSKLKMLNFSSESVETEYISKYFSDNVTYIDSLETSDEHFADIVCYVENENLVQTNIKIRNHSIIKISYEENGFSIKQETLNEDDTVDVFDKFNIFKKFKEFRIKNEYTDMDNTVITKCYMDLVDGRKIEINSRTQIFEQLEKNTEFDNATKVILNDLEDSKLKLLATAINNKIKEIYQNKIQSVMSRIEI